MRRWTLILRFQSAWKRWAIVAVSLCAYLASTIGMPVRVVVSKSDSVPFPCQHHACGCADAKQCWEDCCCYSPQARMAWAQRHHVEPPACLVAQVTVGERCQEHRGHADSAHSSTACCAHDAQANHAVNGDHTACCHQETAPIHRIVFVSGVMARQCKGLPTFWSTSGAVLPPPAAVRWQFQWDVVERLTSCIVLAPSSHLVPPVPPPRV